MKNPSPVAETKKGMNRFVWNMRYPDAKKVPNAVMWGGRHIGPKAVPGEYKVKMTIGGKSQTHTFNILTDPRVNTTQSDFQDQFDLLMDIRNRTTEINEKILSIRSIKAQEYQNYRVVLVNDMSADDLPISSLTGFIVLGVSAPRNPAGMNEIQFADSATRVPPSANDFFILNAWKAGFPAKGPLYTMVPGQYMTCPFSFV